MKHFYNRSQVAGYLEISRQYLYRLEKKVRLRGSCGSHLGVVDEYDVKAWVKENWRVDWYAGQKYFLRKKIDL